MFLLRGAALRAGDSIPLGRRPTVLAVAREPGTPDPSKADLTGRYERLAAEYAAPLFAAMNRVLKLSLL